MSVQRKVWALPAGLGVFGLLLSMGAPAALVTVSGATVDFIYDDADPGLQEYGSLTVVGDSIFAVPTGIRAESTNTQGSVLFNATGSIQVRAKAGFELASIDVSERGDYQMSAGADRVGISGWLSAFNLYDINQFEIQNMAVSGDLTIKGSATANNWFGTAGFDFLSGMWSATQLTHINLTLQNNLEAVSTTQGESAWIQKKFTGGNTVGVVIQTIPTVPVPAAVWLFGSGLLGLVAVARRRQVA